MSMTQADVGLADYGALLRRRWRLVVGGVLVGLIAAGGAIALLPKTYTSTASVMVQSTGENGAVQGGRTSGDVNLDTEAQIVKSTAVAVLALGKLDEPIAEEARGLARHVTVSVPPNTSVLNITFEAGDPEDARDGAAAFADAYLENRSAVASRRVEAQEEGVNVQLKELRAQSTELDKKLVSADPGTPEALSVQSQRDQLNRQIAELGSQLAQLRASALVPGEVITEAQIPQSPASPNVPILLLSCVLSGFLIGFLLAVLLDRLDHRIRDRRDLSSLGLDPLVAGVRLSETARVVASQTTEPMRQLRNALLVQLPKFNPAVLVAPASSGSAGPLVALHLADTMARSGLRVLLVSANSSRCLLSERFDTAGRPGLADILRGRARVREAIFPVPGSTNLLAIHSGSDGSLHSELLQGEQVSAVFAELATRADVMVIDVAPTSENADAQSLVSVASGVLIVAERLRATRSDLHEAIDQFQHVDARVLGAVVAEVDGVRSDARRSDQATKDEAADDLGVEHGGRGAGADDLPSSVPEAPPAWMTDRSERSSSAAPTRD